MLNQNKQGIILKHSYIVAWRDTLISLLFFFEVMLSYLSSYPWTTSHPTWESTTSRRLRQHWTRISALICTAISQCLLVHPPYSPRSFILSKDDDEGFAEKRERDGEIRTNLKASSRLWVGEEWAVVGYLHCTCCSSNVGWDWQILDCLWSLKGLVEYCVRWNLSICDFWFPRSFLFSAVSSCCCRVP